MDLYWPQKGNHRTIKNLFIIWLMGMSFILLLALVSRFSEIAWSATMSNFENLPANVQIEKEKSVLKELRSNFSTLISKKAALRNDINVLYPNQISATDMAIQTLLSALNRNRESRIEVEQTASRALQQIESEGRASLDQNEVDIQSLRADIRELRDSIKYWESQPVLDENERELQLRDLSSLKATDEQNLADLVGLRASISAETLAKVNLVNGQTQEKKDALSNDEQELQDQIELVRADYSRFNGELEQLRVNAKQLSNLLSETENKIVEQEKIVSTLEKSLSTTKQ